jgi:hypothetical protein
LHSRSEPHARARLTSLKINLCTLLSDGARSSSHGFRPVTMPRAISGRLEFVLRKGCRFKNICDFRRSGATKSAGKREHMLQIAHGRRQKNAFLNSLCSRHLPVAMHPLIDQHGRLAGFHAERTSLLARKRPQILLLLSNTSVQV